MTTRWRPEGSAVADRHIERLGRRRGRDTQADGEVAFAAVVGVEGPRSIAELMMRAHRALIEFLRQIVNLKSALITGQRASPVARSLCLSREIVHGPDESRAQSIARRAAPRRSGSPVRKGPW